MFFVLSVCANVFANTYSDTKTLAEQDGAEAQYNLGVMYGKGQGVKQDYVEAAKWFKKAKAAELGYKG